MPLRSGAHLDHDDVTAFIGEGGLGQVWQVADVTPKRQVTHTTLSDRRPEGLRHVRERRVSLICVDISGARLQPCLAGLKACAAVRIEALRSVRLQI